MERVEESIASCESFDVLIRRAHAEYREMPGLRLTFNQMQRLWKLDTSTCARLVDYLMHARMLARTPEGHYMRYGTFEARGPRRTHPQYAGRFT